MTRNRTLETYESTGPWNRGSGVTTLGVIRDRRKCERYMTPDLRQREFCKSTPLTLQVEWIKGKGSFVTGSNNKTQSLFHHLYQGLWDKTHLHLQNIYIVTQKKKLEIKLYYVSVLQRLFTCPCKSHGKWVERCHNCRTYWHVMFCFFNRSYVRCLK